MNKSGNENLAFPAFVACGGDGGVGEVVEVVVVVLVVVVRSVEVQVVSRETSGKYDEVINRHTDIRHTYPSGISLGETQAHILLFATTSSSLTNRIFTQALRRYIPFTLPLFHISLPHLCSLPLFLSLSLVTSFKFVASVLIFGVT